MSSATAVADLRSRDDEVWRVAQLEFSHPVVVEAGAGTGKTSLLVARCLAWTLGEGWRRAERRRPGEGSDRVAAEVLSRVAALTFTEAAAAEMATRIGQALAQVAEGGLPKGAVESALPADGVLRAGRAEALLGALDRLQVRTIHAFCRRLLAEHALGAGLHPQLEVDADGLQARAVAREVVDEGVRAGYSEPGDPELIALAVEGCGPPELEEALAALLDQGAGEDALAASPFTPVRIRAWTEEFGALLRRFDETAGRRLAGATARSPVTRATLDAIAMTARLLEAGAAGQGELEALVTGLREAWPTNCLDRLSGWSRGRFPSEAEKAALGAAIPEAPRGAAPLRSAIVHALALDPARLQRMRRVLAKLLARGRERMRARGSIGYADLLRGARNLLRDQPSVRARVRADVDQLLVDEFQDTDRVQCEILRWLALDDPAQERPGLFLVGDPKQSIYGWREADLRAYEGFVAEALGPGCEPARLSINRRSTPAILAEVERVIAPVMRARAGVQPTFQPLVADAEREKETLGEEGGVEHFVTWEWDSARGGHQHPNANAAARLEAAAIARDLVRLRRAGTIAWRDAGVLFRATGDLEIYLAALRDAGVPYAVERDRSYFRRREVIDATALVCCVLDPEDELALLTWLRSPSVGVPDAALLPLWAGKLPRRVAALTGDDDERLAELAKVIDGVVTELPDDVPGLETVSGWEHALRHGVAVLSALRASFAEDAADVFVEKLRSLTMIEATEASRYLGAYRLANLARFFRDLSTALDTDDVDVQALLRRLRGDVANERERDEPRPPDAGEDAVRVMTIHQAKGLEFRHCYVAQLHKQSGRTRTNVPVELREQDGNFEYRLFEAATLGYARVRTYLAEVGAAEQVRSLYVAMTRARDRLVLLGERSDADEATDPEQAGTHARLLESRAGERPDLAAEMAMAQRDGRDGLLAGDGVRWVFPGLQAEAMPKQAGEAPAVSQLRVHEIADEASCLAGHRKVALRRMRRAYRAAASAESHAEAREAEAERRFEGSDLLRESPAREAAKASGTAVHRLLESLPLDGDLREALERSRERLPAILARLESPEARDEALERALAALDRLAGGPLLARLTALRDVVIARELPLLIPADPEGEGPVGFISGAIDLLYRDPATDELVVVDYKTDRVEGETALRERSERYAGQATHYRRAIQEALALPQPPRFELWFLHAGAVVRLD